MSYKEKYLKYKTKYIDLKKQRGGNINDYNLIHIHIHKDNLINNSQLLNELNKFKGLLQDKKMLIDFIDTESYNNIYNEFVRYLVNYLILYVNKNINNTNNKSNKLSKEEIDNLIKSDLSLFNDDDLNSIITEGGAIFTNITNHLFNYNNDYDIYYLVNNTNILNGYFVTKNKNSEIVAFSKNFDFNDKLLPLDLVLDYTITKLTNNNLINNNLINNNLIKLLNDFKK